jgi:hypothetical protein
MNHRYRKLPVVIEAFQMTAEARKSTDDWPTWLVHARHLLAGEVGSVWPLYREQIGFPIMVQTLENASVKVMEGDWIIKGVEDELYPCKPSVFAATYEQVTDDAEAPTQTET